MTMKNVAYLDFAPCGSCKNRPFGGTYGLHHQGGSKLLRSVFRFVVTVKVFLRSTILIILMMDAILSSETSVLK
jgi:phosphopantetheine adenylyltransferase